MSNPADHLRRVPLFAGMTDRAFEAVASLAGEQALPEGHVLAREGDPGDTFYLVIAGQVAITRAGGHVRDLGPGDFLGEIALVDGHVRSATATTVTPVRVATIEREAFSELMDRFPAVRHGILVALTDRIRSDEADAVA